MQVGRSVGVGGDRGSPRAGLRAGCHAGPGRPGLWARPAHYQGSGDYFYFGWGDYFYCFYRDFGYDLGYDLGHDRGHNLRPIIAAPEAIRAQVMVIRDLRSDRR